MVPKLSNPKTLLTDTVSVCRTLHVGQNTFSRFARLRTVRNRTPNHVVVWQATGYICRVVIIEKT
jgi:hypothetical protein